jgi:uncharacterized protein (DUF2267 family)
VKYDEFLKRTRECTRLETAEQAGRAARATLETLNERIPEREASDLGAQLPRELSGVLASGNRGERFDLDEFFQRVSQREGVDLPQATHDARAVVAVLGEAVSAGEINNIRSVLPEDYAPLFDSGSEGTMQR